MLLVCVCVSDRCFYCADARSLWECGGVLCIFRWWFLLVILAVGVCFCRFVIDVDINIAGMSASAEDRVFCCLSIC